MNLVTQREEKLENLPTHERLKHGGQGRRGYSRKNFNWSHFYGFLESRVGQPVDRVIHEFVNCDWCPAEYRTVKQFSEGVEMNTFKKADGRIWYFCGWSGGQERCIDTDGGYYVNRNPFLYVHPDTRILCEYRRKSKIDYQTEYRAKRKAKIRILGDYHQLYKFKGTWYEVKAEKLPENALVWGKERKGPHDILLESNNEWGWSRYHDKYPFVKIVLKRQLGSKELKKHNLKNDVFGISEVPCKICGGVRCCHWSMAQWKREGII